MCRTLEHHHKERIKACHAHIPHLSFHGWLYLIASPQISFHGWLHLIMSVRLICDLSTCWPPICQQNGLSPVNKPTLA